MRYRPQLRFAAFIMLLTAAPAHGQDGLSAWQLSTERLVSAVKVSTKQVDATPDSSRTAESQSRQALAASLGQHAVNARAAQAKAAYGANTAQGYGVCAAKFGMQSNAIAEKSSAKVAQAVASADQAWLTSGGDASARAVSLLEARRTFYCTKEERQALGWCGGTAATGGMPAGDTNAAPFMLRRDIGPEEAVTAGDYIDTVAPLPTVKAQVRDGAEAGDRLQARRQAAFMTAARGAFYSVVAGAVGGDEE
ncbi:hypothetical protein V5F40_21560 [Xanthobacter sp. DSM 14520]|uniref:hypothetical protein n=1 Tax=Xanthobacter autotrophicus (strain ATCC BAA-1158 / Py2) TaxID=78245 RepID=UPI00372C681B